MLYFKLGKAKATLSRACLPGLVAAQIMSVAAQAATIESNELQLGNLPEATDQQPTSPTSEVSIKNVMPSEQNSLSGATVNQTWLLSTTSTPTAYVLDRNHVQFGVTTQTFPTLDLGFIATEVNYGLTNTITLTLAPQLKFDKSSRLVLGGLHYNFLNADDWSFAFVPLLGFQIGTPERRESGSKGKPVIAQLVASRIIDDRNKVHYSLVAARNAITDRDQFSYTTTYSDGKTTETQYTWARDTSHLGVRASVTKEHRFNARHGLFTSINPYIDKATYQSTSYEGGNQNTWDYSSTDLTYGFTLGIGYIYTKESFSLHIGIETGPKWLVSTYSSSLAYSASSQNDKYTSFSALGSGNASLGIEYRI